VPGVIYMGRYMQFVIVFLLFGFVQPVQAITKCEFKGKVTYKREIALRIQQRVF